MKYKYYGHKSLGFTEDYFGHIGPKVEVNWFWYYALKFFKYHVTKELNDDNKKR